MGPTKTTDASGIHWHWKPPAMRDPEIIEAELMEISAIADDSTKFERIVAWCATHPEEVPFALHRMMGKAEA
jgi:hypothetical protein